MKEVLSKSQKTMHTPQRNICNSFADKSKIIQAGAIYTNEISFITNIIIIPRNSIGCKQLFKPYIFQHWGLVEFYKLLSQYSVHFIHIACMRPIWIMNPYKHAAEIIHHQYHNTKTTKYKWNHKLGSLVWDICMV